jgi:hypothetical protein
MPRSQERVAFGHHEVCFREDALAEALRVERTDLVPRADCHECQVAESIEVGRVVDDLIVERANVVRKEVVIRVGGGGGAGPARAARCTGAAAALEPAASICALRRVWGSPCTSRSSPCSSTTPRGAWASHGSARPCAWPTSPRHGLEHAVNPFHRLGRTTDDAGRGAGAPDGAAEALPRPNIDAIGLVEPSWTAQSGTLTVCTEFANIWRTRPGLDLLAKSVCRQSAQTSCSQTQVFVNCWPTQFAMCWRTPLVKSEGCTRVTIALLCDPNELFRKGRFSVRSLRHVDLEPLQSLAPRFSGCPVKTRTLLPSAFRKRGALRAQGLVNGSVGGRSEWRFERVESIRSDR